MNEEQMNTRKNWLRALIVLMAMNYAYSALYMPKDPAFILLPPLAKTITALSSLLLPLGFNYLVYHCAYKKAGTKLLTFLIIITPVIMIASAAMYILGKVQLPKGFWFTAYMILSNGLALWLYLLHWKMRAINRSLRAQSHA